MLDADMAAWLDTARKFNFVDRDQIPEVSDERWPQFRDHAIEFFVRKATDIEREAIWRAAHGGAAPERQRGRTV
jgi:hypothetical protein